MKPIAPAIVILTLTAAWCQTALEPSSVYISDPLKWERTDRPGRPAQAFAVASILALRPEGDLATISCLVEKTADNQLQILYTEGYSISSGTWKKSGRVITVRFRSIHSTLRKQGERSAQYKEESWPYALSRNGDRVAEWIKIDDTGYVPLGHLHDLEQLARVIQFYRTEAENPK